MSSPYSHVARAIRARIDTSPDAVAMRHESSPGQWQPITYREVGRQVDAVASWLIAHAVERGGDGHGR